MLLTEISSNQALVANQAIGLSATPALITNDNVAINEDNNGLIIKVPGIYKVSLQLTATSSGTDIGAVLYANGEEVTMTKAEETFASGDTGEIDITYPVNVIATEETTQALVQFYSLYGGTVNAGYVTVERIS